jgi:SAM-dependent methyltransferase
MTSPVHSTTPRYSFDNDDPEAIDRHDYLSEMLDGFTFWQLVRSGPLTGWRCLELGAGGGSVACWLAQQVGPTGRVLATDLNPRHLSTDAGYEVVRQDLRNDPVPDGPWDLIHARLVLLHLPERREIVARLVESLAPGGALLLEEWASAQPRLVLAAPDPATGELIDEYHAFLLKVLPARGNDPGWAERVHSVMLEEGLVDVHTEIQASSWPGGTAGAMLIAANVAQLRSDFESAGFAPERLDRLCEAVADPRLVVRGHLTYSTIGRKPSTR